MRNKKYQLALFGDPVKHSLSPQIHQNFARQFDLDINYQLIKVRAEDFVETVSDFFASGGHGANVTLPHKQLALSCVSDIGDNAVHAHAINTLYLNESSQMVGDNTDGIGFIHDLSSRCGFNCHNKHILILGAGGATQGIVPAIMAQRPQQLVIANRSLDKAELIAHFSSSQAVNFEQLEQMDHSFDLIIHASSLGHQGRTLEFFQHQVHNQTLCYDLSYGEAKEAFFAHARSMNITTMYDGLGMLVEQAACAFNLWFGLQVDTQSITEQLTHK